MKVGFLLNHYDAHQVPHVVPYALELSRLYKEIEVVIITSTEEQKQFVCDIASNYSLHNCNIISLKVSALVETLDPILSKWIFAKKASFLRNNRVFLSTFNALVVPELTSLSLKKMNGFEKTKLIFTGHGAGDNPNYYPYDQRLSAFDLCLLPGRKYADILCNLGYVTKNQYAISGYPKFEAVKPLFKNLDFFKRRRTTVIYNPHHNPSDSSWHKSGTAILDYFYNNKKYNLIFSPHVLLFKRSFGRGARLPKKYKNRENVLIDQGSRHSIDMTYMNAADIYVGDVSSQIYEFLQRPRPCIIFDDTKKLAHQSDVYPHVKFGQIVDNVHDMDLSLRTSEEEHKNYISVQKNSFANTFEAIKDGTAGTRGAEIIANFLLHEKINPKWQ